MPRRIHVSRRLSDAGEIALEATQAHHARDVLRLKAGDAVELFDDSGNVADGLIALCEADRVTVRVNVVRAAAAGTTAQIVIASAVPKGERADWMIEKLSELGVSRFTPLATARSVVLPAGQNKRERWIRIATESAKQSRRAGVMQIDELTPLGAAIASAPDGIYLSTVPEASPIVSSFKLHPSSFAFIGPEGGWTDGEVASFEKAGLTGVKLTATILRVETAAVAAAAVVACLQQQGTGQKPATGAD